MPHMLCLWLLLLLPITGLPAAESKRPNIIWLTSEDHGPHLGCYGDPIARTPNADALAAKGLLFQRAWSCAPVCAPARTTLISGMYPTSTGAEHMRSEVPLPKGTRMYPQFLREAGYYCSNNSKEDYNLTKPEGVWDDSSGKAHWKNRQAGQPFFAIFNSTKSHESQIRTRPHTAVTDPAKVRVPAYHPDTKEVREDWAQYYDKVSEADADAGRLLKELAEAGLAEETIVFYYADHGSGMPRNKRWPCNSGLQVPLVVYFPDKWRHLAPKEYQPGGRSERLVSFVDFAPTLLSLAGIKPPSWMQGHAFAGKHQTAPQSFIHGFRGRMDERIDLVRSVTDGRYVYLRNYMPHLSQAQKVNYQFQTPTTVVWRELFDQDKTSEAQSIFWKVPKAPEELYDLQTDPDEVRNLAGSAQHQAILKKLRKAQQEHAERIRDVGFLPEAEMQARAGADAPYDMGHDSKRYDFKKVFAAAELASLLRPEAVADLKRLTRDKDSAVRYWGVMGLRMRGSVAVNDAKEELRAALKDSSPSVRIAAAEALGVYGSTDDLSLALAVLKKDSDPTQTSAYAGIAAMNALDKLGSKATALVDHIRSMPVNDPRAVGRANEYVRRLQEEILSNFGASPAKAAAGKAKGKKAR